MTKEEKVHTAYMHACLKFVEKQRLTNQTLRKRFGIWSRFKKIISCSSIIRDAIDSNKIKPMDPDTSPKHMKFIAF